jgi:hypothetical protein
MIISIQQFIDDARRWIVACGAIAFLYLTNWLSDLYKFNFLWYLLAVPFLYYLSVLLEKSLFKIIYKFPPVRKWILKKHFIEGYWIETLYDKNKMESIAILQIVFDENNSYIIKGESYTLTGEYRGSFITPNTSYHEEEFALRYAYSGKVKDALIAGTGILEFQLGKKKEIAHSFSGHLIDNFHVKGATFKGERIYDLSKVASLRAKKDFMHSYMSEKIWYKKERVFSDGV